MLPPRKQHPAGMLPLIPSDARPSPEPNSDNAHESPTESASSRETWPAGDVPTKTENDKEKNSHPVIRRVSVADKISLREISTERIDIVSEKMHRLPDEFLDELKTALRIILDAGNGSNHREEFLMLQKNVQSRSDLTAKNLLRAHRALLEILVAINTCNKGFLHPNISLSQSSLVEVFCFKKCRNIACQSQVPVDDCSCEICSNRSGFCNLCMCVMCNNFDFEVNTCRWIGCDFCSHWTHTDCAIRDALIFTGSSLKNGVNSSEMLFRCRACNRTSELLGWVRDVFQHCAPSWDREILLRELDFVSRIFRVCEEPRGRKLVAKCEEVSEKLKSGLVDSTASRIMLMFFQDLDMESHKHMENGDGGRLIAPQEACNRIAEVVHEAISKMEMVADEKMRLFKKARMALEACDREIAEKTKEKAEIMMEWNQKKQQIEELEKIVRLKQAEADMFQMKAHEAKREAERLQRIALAKTEKSEEEYADSYLKLRLSEAEAEKQYLFEKIKFQESAPPYEAAQGFPHSKIHDLLHGYGVTAKSEPLSDKSFIPHANRLYER